MGDEIHFISTGIRKHAEELKSDIAPKLQKARATLNEKAMIEGGDFSITGTLASMAYPGALQFAFEDMETHKKMIDDFASGVEVTAQNYQGSDDASTITWV